MHPPALAFACCAMQCLYHRLASGHSVCMRRPAPSSVLWEGVAHGLQGSEMIIAIVEPQQYARYVGIACAGLRITSTDDLLSAGWKPPARVDRDEDFEFVPTPEMRPDDRPQPERSTPRR